jgi:LysM repeat protein
MISYAGAANANDYDYSTTYFDIGAGFGSIANLPTGAFAGSAAVGYQFNRYVGLEAGWDGMPSQQWGLLDNYNIYSLSVKGTLPLSDNFSLYGKLGSGVGYSTWSGVGPQVYSSANSATTWDGVVGVGAAFKVSPHFDLYLENKTFVPLTSQPGNFSTANATLFGFQYNFSAPTAKASATNQGYSVSDTSQTISQAVLVQTQPAVAPVIAPVAVVAPAAVVETQESSDFQSRIKNQGARKYIVIRRSDTLYSIAHESKIPLSELQLINHLNKATSKIEIGNKLYLD